MVVTKYIDKECTNPIPDSEAAIIYKPSSDDNQQHCFRSICDGRIPIAVLPTGSGKTRIEQYAVAHHLIRGGKVAVTTPIKTLSNQKYSDYGEFLSMLRDQKGIEADAGIMTGDHKINPDADVVVMTTEILKNSLNRIDDDNHNRLTAEYIDKLSCVVFDEAHYINDRDRGGVWESIMILLDKKINIVLLSATLGGIEMFAQWLSRVRDRDVDLVISTKRPVPLVHHLFFDKMHKIMDTDNVFVDNGYDRFMSDMKGIDSKRNVLLNTSVRYLKDHDLLPAIYFTLSKNNCEAFSKELSVQLLTAEESIEAVKMFDKLLLPHKDICMGMAQYHKIRDKISKGIAFHHSGVHQLLKEVTEMLFKRGMIKVLFATETFAVGINMPTRTVVFAGVEKPTGAETRRPLMRDEYTQMAGRAGRRGIDNKGTVIILPIFGIPDRIDLKNMLAGELPVISSKLKIDYSLILTSMVVSNYTLSDVLSRSLLSYDIDRSLKMIDNEIDRIRDDIRSVSNIDENISDFDEYIKHLRHVEEMGRSGINVKLNQKQKKKIKALENRVLADERFIKYKELSMMKQELSQKEKDRVGLESYVSHMVADLRQLLEKYGFLADDKLTDSGRIASQIHDCNPLLLSQILLNDVLIGLKEEEIVGVLAVFLNEKKSGENIYMNDLNVSSAMIGCIKTINDMAKSFESIESEYGLLNDNYWNINLDYVEAAYKWASGVNLNTIVSNYGVFPGNFIKNMLQLYKLVDDIRNLLRLHGDNRLIPILNVIDSMIYKNEVSTESLYLSQKR